MLARLTKIKEENEEGFTLIELLVVIIIIGILAAIAIPVFLSQRNKGYDAGIKSDLRNAATAEESYLTDYNSYVGVTAASPLTPGATTTAGSDSQKLAQEGLSFSTKSDYTGGVQEIDATAKGTGFADSYCLQATSASGNIWSYDSSKGGLGSKGQACS